ncbi:Nonribosomal peptide synthetase 7, partial [Kappamyces sp. JEL0680]
VGTQGYPTLAEIRTAIHEGISNALARGPLQGYPVSQVHVRTTRLGLYGAHISNAAAIRTAAYTCTKQLLASSEMKILEPIMALKITVPSQYVGNIGRDLSSQRRGLIHSVEAIDGDRTVVDCEAPLASLVGYASSLRGVTHGTGEFVQSLAAWRIQPKGK